MPNTDVVKNQGQPEVKLEKGILDKATLRKSMLRDMFTLQWSWNYERMQALGFLWAMLPSLQKIYKQPEELKDAMKRHLQFYNTNPTCSPLILGAAIALEEDKAGKAANGIKVGMMGPLAGIGDTMQAVLYRPIICVIAAALAMSGSVVGPLLIVLSGLLWMGFKIPLFWLGYNQSSGLIHKVTGEKIIDKITGFVTIAGLIVIGGFVPSILKGVTTPLQFAQSVMIDGKAVEKVVKLQDTLNSILPFMIPVAIVGLGYYLIKGRRMSPVVVLLILVALAFISKIIGIL